MIRSAELLTLIPVPGEVHPAGGFLSCELADEHAGSHVALLATAQDGNQWWWARWDGQLREVLVVAQMDLCPDELPQGDYADECLLPRGHLGPHSFDLAPLQSRRR
ncbi:MAG: hypothetical protein ACJ786_10820 [Catenulispora sp.]